MKNIKFSESTALTNQQVWQQIIIDQSQLLRKLVISIKTTKLGYKYEYAKIRTLAVNR